MADIRSFFGGGGPKKVKRRTFPELEEHSLKLSMDNRVTCHRVGSMHSGIYGQVLPTPDSRL